jgi:hypothetical protein
MLIPTAIRCFLDIIQSVERRLCRSSGPSQFGFLPQHGSVGWPEQFSPSGQLTAVEIIDAFV